MIVTEDMQNWTKSSKSSSSTLVLKKCYFIGHLDTTHGSWEKQYVRKNS